VAVNLWPVAMATVGGVLLWTGINDPSGGPLQVARDLIAGKRPTPGAQKSVIGSNPDGIKAGGTAGPAGNSIQGSIKGAGIAALALTFKGAPYSWGGTSKSGIDCSGLVLVCYRQVAGIRMAHDATSQTRKGRIIPRAQCAAGDLVAWGSPARYPHIAIAINNTECMGAWTWGVPAGVQKIDQRMYNGLPTIFRVPM
jgi:cell wall-associated NlpC family hydrolase